MITNLYPELKGIRRLSSGMENAISPHTDDWSRNFYYGIDNTVFFIYGTSFIGVRQITHTIT